MSQKERTMNMKKEQHMFRFKPGFRDKEQLVISKLFSLGIGERPEIHLFTDGSKEPDSIIKVKTFAAVQEGDQVPKIVKAKHDNYICVVGSGTKGKPTYIRTDTREQRDEWCRLLQTLMSMKTTPHQQPLEPHRGRTQTDATSNRPGVSRARKGAPITAPGSMQGIFHAELDKVIKKRVNQVESIDEDGNDTQVCCGLHHIEAAATNDGDQDTYENVHHVHNLDDWRRQQQTSKQALKMNQELYQDFHETNILQEQLGQPEDDYETPVSFQNFLPRSENRLSGSSTSSEESEGGASAMSDPRSLRSNKEPVESSWPPSPVNSDESEPEYQAERMNLKISKAESREELVLYSKEPEASLCLDEQDEPLYVNTSLFQRKPGTIISRTPTVNRTPRDNTRKPVVPERTQSVKKNQVPPKLPKRNTAKNKEVIVIEDKCRKLKDEKLAGLAEVQVAKTTVVRNLPELRLKKINDCILITNVPEELKDHFCTGDQLLQVNDTNLNSVCFAETCVQMSDKPEIKITVRRIPFGTICDFPWTSQREADIGLKIQGNEIERVQPIGLAHRRGSLQSNDTTCMNTVGLRCNYVITEINFDPVHPDASTEEVWDTIKKTPGIVVLILHPVDFRTVQRGYWNDDDGLYQNSNLPIDPSSHLHSTHAKF